MKSKKTDPENLKFRKILQLKRPIVGSTLREDAFIRRKYSKKISFSAETCTGTKTGTTADRL